MRTPVSLQAGRHTPELSSCGVSSVLQGTQSELVLRLFLGVSTARWKCADTVEARALKSELGCPSGDRAGPQEWTSHPLLQFLLLPHSTHFSVGTLGLAGPEWEGQGWRWVMVRGDVSYCSPLSTGEWPSGHSSALCRHGICPHLGTRALFTVVCCLLCCILYLWLRMQPNLSVFASSGGCDAGPRVVRVLRPGGSWPCPPGALAKK